MLRAWGSQLRGAHTDQGDATALQPPQRAAALPLAKQACSLVLNLGAGGIAGCPSALGVGTTGTLTPPQSRNSWVKNVGDTKCLVSWAASGFAPSRPHMMKGAKLGGGGTWCFLSSQGSGHKYKGLIILGEGLVCPLSLWFLMEKGPEPQE